jgi:hypothetical protein
MPPILSVTTASSRSDFIAETVPLKLTGRPAHFAGVAWPLLAKQLPILKGFVADHTDYMLSHHPEDCALIEAASMAAKCQIANKVIRTVLVDVAQ